MEKWIFLGSQWQELSVPGQMCVSLCHQRHCVWCNAMPFKQYIPFMYESMTKKNIEKISLPEKESNLETVNLPELMTKYWLKRQIRHYSKDKIITILTDKPSFHKLIDNSLKNVIWVYLRPGCRNCASHFDKHFLINDPLMIEKANLVAFDEKKADTTTSRIPPEKKVCFNSCPPLVRGQKQKAQFCERIVGYYGPMDSQVNVDLIAQAAMAMPSWIFELYITCGKIPETLHELPNIVVKQGGKQNNFFSRWDVAIMPFKRNLSYGCHNPPLLIDYIRFGIPVAATSFLYPTEIPFPVILQKPREPFATTIRRALEQPSTDPPSFKDFDQCWNEIVYFLGKKVKSISSK